MRTVDDQDLADISFSKDFSPYLYVKDLSPYLLLMSVHRHEALHGLSTFLKVNFIFNRQHILIPS